MGPSGVRQIGLIGPKAAILKGGGGPDSSNTCDVLDPHPRPLQKKCWGILMQAELPEWSKRGAAFQPQAGSKSWFQSHSQSSPGLATHIRVR